MAFEVEIISRRLVEKSLDLFLTSRREILKRLDFFSPLPDKQELGVLRSGINRPILTIKANTPPRI